MDSKIRIILEVLVIFIAFVYLFFKMSLPEIKNKFGSSDRILNANKYKNMVEINIDDNVDFALLFDSNSNMYHMFFFNENALVLYNRNIENNNISDGCSLIIDILRNNKLLKSESLIKVTRYNDTYYNKFIDSFRESLNNNDFNNNIEEFVSTIEEKSLSLNINYASDFDSLNDFDSYSKNIASNGNTSVKNNNNFSDDISSLSLTNKVYKQLEKYVKMNNIDNLDVNDSIDVSLIPIDSSKNMYPTSNSWFYVADGNIYAYIEINDNNKVVGYCYKGAIDLVSEGVC